MEQKIIANDKTWVGIILGSLIPILFLYVYYYFALSQNLDFSGFINKFKTSNQFLTSISTCLLLCNALLFGIFVQFRKLNVAKGIFIPTLLIGLFFLAYKFWG